MGKVFLNVSGDGSAYCVPPAGEELVNGEQFTVYFTPDGGAELTDVRPKNIYLHINYPSLI